MSATPSTTDMTSMAMESVMSAAGWLGSGLWATLLVIILLLVAKAVLIRVVRGKSEILKTSQRRWINSIRNGILILGIFLLVMIWAPQLQTFALSLTAIAVAIVISFKEMILCITGGFYRAATKPFEVGDWIICGEIGGEVVSMNPISVKIEQVDRGEGKSYQFTGRSVHIPNSSFFTTNILNANFLKSHRYEDFIFVIPNTTPLSVAEMEAIALKEFQTLYDPMKKEAEQTMRKVRRVSGIDFPMGAPSAQIDTTELGHFRITLSALVSTPKLADFRAQVNKTVLSALYAEASKREEKSQ